MYSVICISLNALSISLFQNIGIFYEYKCYVLKKSDSLFYYKADIANFGNTEG